ncbi:hypothetical protein [Haloterrigena gelatinilytica]|nr:hypothetical protein [Haloterrigena gelatinilytica]
MLDSFQQWQLGLALLFVLSLAGTVGGALLGFLALSYWCYGR